MNKQQIIEELANTKQIEKIVYKLAQDSKNPFDCLDDLIQDIYLIILDKPDTLIEELYTRNELGYYLLKIAKNQLLSENSPYYTQYIKLKAKSDEITEEFAETYIGKD